MFFFVCLFWLQKRHWHFVACATIMFFFGVADEHLWWRVCIFWLIMEMWLHRSFLLILKQNSVCNILNSSSHAPIFQFYLFLDRSQFSMQYFRQQQWRFDICIFQFKLFLDSSVVWLFCSLLCKPMSSWLSGKAAGSASFLTASISDR